MSAATGIAGLQIARPAPGATGAPLRLSTGPRIVAAMAALGCLAVLLVAARLTPAPAGHGTHAQLGLPACGWVAVANVPCPTCGMTTAFAHLAHGQPVQALIAQPFGAMLGMAMAAGFWIALHAALTGSRAATALTRLIRPWPLSVIGVLWIGAWGYKIVTWPT